MSCSAGTLPRGVSLIVSVCPGDLRRLVGHAEGYRSGQAGVDVDSRAFDGIGNDARCIWLADRCLQAGDLDAERRPRRRFNGDIRDYERAVPATSDLRRLMSFNRNGLHTWGCEDVYG